MVPKLPCILGDFDRRRLKGLHVEKCLRVRVAETHAKLPNTFLENGIEVFLDFVLLDLWLLLSLFDQLKPGSKWIKSKEGAQGNSTKASMSLEQFSMAM